MPTSYVIYQQLRLIEASSCQVAKNKNYRHLFNMCDLKRDTKNIPTQERVLLRMCRIGFMNLYRACFLMHPRETEGLTVQVSVCTCVSKCVADADRLLGAAQRHSSVASAEIRIYKCHSERAARAAAAAWKYVVYNLRVPCYASSEIAGGWG